MDGDCRGMGEETNVEVSQTSGEGGRGQFVYKIPLEILIFQFLIALHEGR